MEILPASIQREGSSVVIQWSDGACSKYSPKLLRDACPCATCKEKHGSSLRNPEQNGSGDQEVSDGGTTKQPLKMILPVLSPKEARPLEILGMRPVGNYAYNISFSDGHDSGIYTFEMLRFIDDR